MPGPFGLIQANRSTLVSLSEDRLARVLAVRSLYDCFSFGWVILMRLILSFLDSALGITFLLFVVL